MFIEYLNPLVARALQIASATRNAKKGKKKKQQTGTGRESTLGKPGPGYPHNTAGVDGDKFPNGPLVPACNGAPAFRIWSRVRAISGEGRGKIGKKTKAKLRKVASDSSNDFTFPKWIAGDTGINPAAKKWAKSQPNHGNWSGHSDRASTTRPPFFLPRLASCARR